MGEAEGVGAAGDAAEGGRTAAAFQGQAGGGFTADKAAGLGKRGVSGRVGEQTHGVEMLESEGVEVFKAQHQRAFAPAGAQHFHGIAKRIGR